MSFFRLLILPLLATALVVLAPAKVRAQVSQGAVAVPVAAPKLGQQDDARDLKVFQCKLKDCWKEVFPRIHSTVEDGAQALERYTKDFDAKMERADRYDRREPDWEAKRLQYKLAILKQYLAECEELRDGPDEPRHLILVGHLFDADGKNQHLVGHTVYEEILERECGRDDGSNAFQKCRRHIVILEDSNKRDLYNYLSLLGRGSVRSITYAGHGISSAKVLGPKQLLLPVDWNPQLSVSQDQWSELNTGMLYARDLDQMAPLLTRVIKPESPIRLYACNTGNELGPKWKSIVGSSPVEACLVGMHFEYMDQDGEWKTDWDNPVPVNAVKTRLVPDTPGMFKQMEAPKSPKGSGAPKTDLMPNTSEHPAAADPSMPSKPEDFASRDIVLRLAIGAADEALVDHGKRLVIFSFVERQAIKHLYGNYVHGKSIDKNFSYELMTAALEDAIKGAKLTDDKRELKRLLEKLRDCVEEAVRVYYKKK